MKLPGFNGEASLGRPMKDYPFHLSKDKSGGSVFPAFRRQSIAGCGACTELKWPNGTGTGACVQDCCDLLGNCKIQACPCGGSVSGFTRSFGVGSFLAR